jgi:SET domain-containing protein
VRIGIFTLREVAPGEELTYDYMFEHYGLTQGSAAGFRCLCGAPQCR